MDIQSRRSALQQSEMSQDQQRVLARYVFERINAAISTVPPVLQSPMEEIRIWTLSRGLRNGTLTG